MWKPDYYRCLVMGIIEMYPAFDEIVTSTCPTYWIDGTVCSYSDDRSNKASMEVDYLIDMGLL